VPKFGSCFLAYYLCEGVINHIVFVIYNVNCEVNWSLRVYAGNPVQFGGNLFRLCGCVENHPQIRGHPMQKL
jgi:hypothetical protein